MDASMYVKAAAWQVHDERKRNFTCTISCSQPILQWNMHFYISVCMRPRKNLIIASGSFQYIVLLASIDGRP